MSNLSQHWLDSSGNPEGGVSSGRGFTISWQRGPLGKLPDRTEPNGAFVEDVIVATKQRIQFYQHASGGKFACDENKRAIEALDDALQALDARTRRRIEAGTEGTHEV